MLPTVAQPTVSPGPAQAVQAVGKAVQADGEQAHQAADFAEMLGLGLPLAGFAPAPVALPQAGALPVPQGAATVEAQPLETVAISSAPGKSGKMGQPGGKMLPDHLPLSADIAASPALLAEPAALSHVTSPEQEVSDKLLAPAAPDVLLVPVGVIAHPIGTLPDGAVAATPLSLPAARRAIYAPSPAAEPDPRAAASAAIITPVTVKVPLSIPAPVQAETAATQDVARPVKAETPPLPAPALLTINAPLAATHPADVAQAPQRPASEALPFQGLALAITPAAAQPAAKTEPRSVSKQGARDRGAEALAGQPAPLVSAQTAGIAGQPDSPLPVPAALPVFAADLVVPLQPSQTPSADPLVRAAPAAAAPGTDFAGLIDRLVEARDAAGLQSGGSATIGATLAHAEFGRVAMQFRSEDGALSVSMASNDPGFAPAVQMAATTSAAAANDDRGAPSRQDQQQAGASAGQASDRGAGQSATGSQPQSQSQQNQPQQAQSRSAGSPRSVRDDPAAAGEGRQHDGSIYA